MGRASQKFDRQLFTLKLSEPARQMQMESLASDNAARSAKMAGSVSVRIVDGQLAVLRKWLETVDRVCREVWQTQGETLTGEFVREILTQEAMTAIGVRVGVTNSHVDRTAGQTHEDPYAARHHLALEVNRLKAEVATRYEIELRELEYQNALEDLPWQKQVPTSQPVDQRENLLDAILKRKSRIAEIERILNRPPLTELRGQPVHGGENWRLRLEEDKQHGLIAVAELEAELERQCEAAKPIVGPSGSEWQEFHNRFMHIANEEERIERAASKDRLLRAYCDYHEHPEILHEKGKPEQGPFCLLRAPETGLWMLSDGVNENFQERFRVLAARAGVTLGSPKGTDPEDFWLHRLYLDLRANKSDLLLGESSQPTNMIKRVCLASATFCSRLERKALETSASSPARDANPPNERESFVLPLLTEKGWSILDWATNAGVDFHTASDYIKGRTNPYKSTRTKLAKSLGVEVRNLPS